MANSVWKPETFTNFTVRQKTDPEGADNALDFTMQTLAAQTQSALSGVATLQPTGGTTKNRPANPTLYSWFYDSTLGKPIMFIGRGNWVDATGTLV